MGVLQRFERRLGGLVEGAFAKVFKGGVEPVELAGALARECDDRKAISATRSLVPNEFTIALSPVLFGTGIRLFEDVDANRLALEPARAEPTPRVTHLTCTVHER